MKIKIAFKSNLFLLLKTVTFILTHALGKKKWNWYLFFHDEIMMFELKGIWNRGNLFI